MESVGQRMTRSRAKALGTPLVDHYTHKTPDPKTTGRRRRGAAQQLQSEESAEAERRQLQFVEQLPATSHEEQPQVEVTPEPEIANVDSSAANLEPTIAASEQDGSIAAVEEDIQPGAHDHSSVLVASPLVPAVQEVFAESSAEHLLCAQDQGAQQDSNATAANSSQQPWESAVESSLTEVPSFAPTATSPLPAPSPRPEAPDVMAVSPLPMAVSPLPVPGSPLSLSNSPANLGPAVPQPIPASPLGAGAPSPAPAVAAMDMSPLPVTTPLSFTSDAPEGMAASVQPPTASFPATPLSLTASMEEAMEAADFSPMPDDLEGLPEEGLGLGGSPISLSGGAAVTPLSTPLPPQQQQQQQGIEMHFQQQAPGAADDRDDAAMADVTPPPAHVAPSAAVSPLTFVSDCRQTPLADPFPGAGFVGGAPDSVPHGAAQAGPSAAGPSAAGPSAAGVEASPADISTFQGFAALPVATGAVQPQVESPTLGGFVNGAPLAGVPSPSPISEALPGPDPQQLQHAAADTPLSDALTPASLSALDVAQSAEAAATSLPTPTYASTHPRAPAPTPETEAVASWHLAATPLANAIAVSMSTAATPTGTGDAPAFDAAAVNNPETDDLQPSGAACCNSDDMMEDVQPMEREEPAQQVPADETTPAAAITPIATAKTPTVTQPRSALPASRTPLAGASRATPAATTPGVKVATGIKTAMRSAAKAPGSSYVFVESRYNKTPAAAGTASKTRPGVSSAGGMTTPVAPTNVTAGAKSIKRVSIHTPEGLRTVAVQQRQPVVPTPYRPKSAQPEQPQPDEQQQQPEAAPAAVPRAAESAVAEERRAKAAERLKAIHAGEQAAPAATSGPGYLAPTAAFAVKKAVRSKVDAGSYDPRSLRQLKKDVKAAVAKKEAKATTGDPSEARDVKLTPKVPERQLPMPDDMEESDEEAQYNECQENDLVTAMTSLEVVPPKGGVPMPLRGLPAPQGKHIRFGETGEKTESPQRVVLRGLPVATGAYKRFD